MIKKKAQKFSCISRTILCSPESLNWFPPSQIWEQYSCCIVLFFWPLIWPRFFILVLFTGYLLICYFSTSLWLLLPLVRDFLPLWASSFCGPLPREGLWDFHLHCFILPSTLLLVSMWVIQCCWWRCAFLHSRTLCFVYHS